MRCVITFALSAALAGSTAASAAQETVTESGLLAAFEADGHPAQRANRGDLARAEAARVRAGTLSNPQLAYAREQPEGGPVQTTWTLAWTPPLDGRPGLLRSAADAGVEAARQRLAAERLRLRAELRRAFSEWSLARERREVLGRHREDVVALAVQAERRAELGEESGLSARRLRLATVEAAAALAAAEVEITKAQAQVRSFVPDLASGARPDRLGLPPAPPEPLLAEAPELAALRSEARQAELEERLSRRFVAFPELQGGWLRLVENGRSRSGAVLGASLTVPLFDRSQGARLEASRRRDIAEARVTLAEARARAGLAAARSAYEILFSSAREAIEAAAGTEELLRAATASFRAGESSLTDLLDVLRTVREARLAEIELRRAALEAHRDLEVAVGRPLPEGGVR